MKVSKKLDDNTEVLDQLLGVEKSYDMNRRDLSYAGKRFVLYFVDGLVKDDIMNFIMTNLANLERKELSIDPIQRLLQTEIPYIELEKTDKMKDIINQLLSGPVVLFIEGAEEALVIDARTYPVRSPQEPDLERVVRGARDGFVETIVVNTALTRRRVRDPSFRLEHVSVGKRSKTDICIGYLEDIANPPLVENIKQKLKKINVDGLPMAEKSVEEYLFGHYWNPYPMVRYTERPDVAAVHLFEGHVLVYVDTSPSVMITPTTFFHHVQHAEEYRQKPAVGAFLRWVRFLAMFASLFLLPLWYLLAIQPDLTPGALQFLGPEKMGQLPLIVQIIIAELGIEILRMASVHTPSALATALGLIAAILLGEMAIKVGLFIPEVILYISVAAIGTFATPSYELGLANKMMRLLFLLAVAIFKTPGLIVAVLAWFIYLARAKSINTPYLWPLIPFNGKALIDVLVRSPIPIKDKRPQALSTQDPDR
ncbi:spore germination protein [Mechercharimyces sp. CAU 1602]|uniref:spore germination protein n=1 Tax=Mechercharimyces sp. CAU 1602 TaxID=2973933 RepID=UPI002163C338|nr:spore germination protein [Mechercharimyces sp. CAU 1602]MCS1351536.1 spore germination protein [Mechercharimyces sp. CAU 1602]